MGIVEIVVASIGLVSTIVGFAAGKYSGKKAALRVVDKRTAAQAAAKPKSKVHNTPRVRRT